MPGNSWKLYAGKFFGNYMLVIPPDGNHVLGNLGLIMAQCYYSFKAMVPETQLSIPAAQTFLE